MALDESKEDDETFKVDTLQFLVNKDLLKEMQPITIDYVTTPTGEGFTVMSGRNEADACGSCSSC